MKINFLKFKKKNNLKKKTFSINVNFYWKSILFLSLFILLIGFALGLFVFLKINKDFILPEIKKGSLMEKIKEERIQKVFDYFSQKEENSLQILNNNFFIVDPSK